MTLIGNPICADCGKPIGFGQPSYQRSGSIGEAIKVYHSACGDPFFIKKAIADERERCARIAEEWDNGIESDQISAAARSIAEAIRRPKNDS